MDHDLITFDLDGTLVDTAAEIAEAANRALEAHGLARRPPAEIVLLIGAGAHSLVRELLLRCAAEDMHGAVVPTEAVLETFEHGYADIAGTLSAPYPSCVVALTRLRAAGLNLACVTNKELRHARAVLRKTGLEDFFETIVGGDSFEHKKPHPSVLRRVAADLGIGLQRVAHVGDSAIDVAAARNAGVAAWAVPYGYNAGTPVAECNPDRMFDDLAHVADYLLGRATGG